MENKEILEKVLIKAYLKNFNWAGIPLEDLLSVIDHDLINGDSFTFPYYSIIFDHDFAKAFWGEEELSYSYYSVHYPNFYGKNWQYHLSSMVLKPEPLKYLERYL